MRGFNPVTDQFRTGSGNLAGMLCTGCHGDQTRANPQCGLGGQAYRPRHTMFTPHHQHVATIPLVGVACPGLEDIGDLRVVQPLHLGGQMAIDRLRHMQGIKG